MLDIVLPVAASSSTINHNNIVFVFKPLKFLHDSSGHALPLPTGAQLLSVILVFGVYLLPSTVLLHSPIPD